MSVRRGLSVLVIAGVAAALAAPAASAKTKVVVAGGPPPKASQAGGLKFPAELDMNAFFRKTVTIHAGDSVKWVFSKRVVHTVTFLAKGDTRPPLEGPDPANPYSGFNDSQGSPFWFNGQPSIAIPPEHAFPQGGDTADGKTYRNAGLSAPAFKPYTLKFPKKGTYKYLCLVHPGMDARVKVLPKSATIPSAKADRKARNKEYAKALKDAKRLGKLKPKGNSVVAGNDSTSVAWFRFFPATRTIKAGESVRFSITSKSEIHTMSFGPQPTDSFVMVLPQPAGPPRIQFDPRVIFPSDVPPLPPYTGANHGDGFFNTGVIDTNPASPNPSSVDVTFTKAGSYVYECTIHPGMQGTIKVE
jgi:plastocyanin